MGDSDFATQLRDVKGFVFERFSPKQRQQIEKNQARPNVTVQGQIRLKPSHSNFNWPGIPWNVCIGPQKLLSHNLHYSFRLALKKTYK